MSAAAASLIGGAVARVDDFPAAMLWAPDGATLVVGGGEGRLFEVNPITGATRKFGEHGPGVLELAWQPKGELLASAGQDGSVRLWQGAASAVEPRVLHRSARWPAGLAWRADGQALAFASGKDVLLFAADGSALRALSGHSVTLSHLAWRGRDELIAAGNGALFVDRVDTGAVEQFVLEGTPLTLSLSPDLKIAASGLADGTINFRYLNNRKRSRMSGYEGKVALTAWSANSRYLASAATGASSLAVWDFGGKGPEGSAPLELNAHEERVESLAWQSTGTLLASAGRDWRVVLWKPGPGSRKALDIQLLDGPAGMICWSPDARRLAVAQPSGAIRFFSVKLA
jgi:WD40 repeat protein